MLVMDIFILIDFLNSCQIFLYYFTYKFISRSYSRILK